MASKLSTFYDPFVALLFVKRLGFECTRLTFCFACAAGIGIRVESNSSGEFEVEHVHRNGAAERNGNVFVGDVIDTIDGRPVNGLKLMELGVSAECKKCMRK
jgi:C-terminal processing protease CtpA/Prc